MASSSTSSFEKKYPYPSEFKVTEFVPELNENNYRIWKRLMVNFIKRRGLSGFIDDTVKAPLASNGSGGDGEKVENEEYMYWERSDILVRGWILAMLPKNILQSALLRTTAREVWKMLERRFDLCCDLQLDEEEDKSLSYYRPLHIAAINGDWESASKFIIEEPNAVWAPITQFSETALHVAIKSVQRNDFVKKLLENMSPQNLALRDKSGLTALHVAAEVDNIEAAKLLVEKNPNLPNISMDDGAEELPLHLAAEQGNREMVSYLWDATRLDVEDKSGAKLLCALTYGELYDFALILLQRNPELACMEGDYNPSMIIVEKRSSFRRGTSLNFWQNLIYSNQHSGRRGDIENLVGCFTFRWTYVKQRLHAIFWKVAEKIVPQMKYIREMKLIHHQALELVRLLCKEVAKSNLTKAERIFKPMLFKATSVGIHEIVEEILGIFPSMIFLRNPKQQSIFQYAIVCRRENVFNLIYQFNSPKNNGISKAVLGKPDALGNNVLHLAACLEPQQQLRLRVTVPGAVLQMQRELQWFKDVENFGLPRDKDAKNNNGMTPAEVFTDTHKELVKEGERWMRETTNSLIIVAALMGTVVFAAAITVPGGNNNESGHPIFYTQNAFIVFAISDALALFSSILFVMIFLSILTCRYAEQDFLYDLPKRLIIGLITLFISILSTMIAFTAILYLVFGYNNIRILIPIVAFASLPLYYFVALQFPLIVEMVRSTYGPSIFGKQSDHKVL